MKSKAPPVIPSNFSFQVLIFFFPWSDDAILAIPATVVPITNPIIRLFIDFLAMCECFKI